MNASQTTRPSPIGLRERNKQDKRLRIRQAALTLFESKGYENTTTREIAEAADVGIGTVFMYADDKRDLLFLIFNDDLDRIVDEAFAQPDPQKPLSAQVADVFAHFYEAFHPRATLARLLLKELVFFSEGKQAGQYLANRAKILAGLEALVGAARASGRLATTDTPQHIANVFFFLYSGEIRLWLSAPNPTLDAGINRMRQTFALLGTGLGEQVDPV